MYVHICSSIHKARSHSWCFQDERRKVFEKRISRRKEMTELDCRTEVTILVVVRLYVCLSVCLSICVQ